MPDGGFKSDLMSVLTKVAQETPTKGARQNSAAYEIWDAKYRLKTADGTPVDNSPTDTAVRTVHALYKNDPRALEEAPKILRAILEGRFVPGGRILAGAGTGRSITLINCFVNSSVQDSLSKNLLSGTSQAALETSLPIMAALDSLAVTLQAGGGMGTDFSTLRPKGAWVKGVDAEASGAISFMKVWDAACKTIMSAGARRGAMMATMDIDHPEVLDFIECKKESGVLTQFNISVKVTDAFMRAVKEDKLWDLGFFAPRADRKHVEIQRKKVPSNHIGIKTDAEGFADWYVYTRMPAREIWDRIMRNTYDYAEPGVIFIDTVNNRNNLQHSELISCTNPCVTGDTLVLTNQGWVRIDAMLHGNWSVVGSDGKMHEIKGGKAFTTGVKEVFEVRLSTGAKIKATADHLFYTSNRGDVALKDLTEKDVLLATPGHLSTGLRKVANGGYEEFSFLTCSMVGKPRSLGIDRVYDLTEPATSHFIANGILIHNCGEQPLPPNSICNLFAILVATFVKTDEDGDRYFDYEALEETAFISARFGDNVLETTDFPREAQRAEAKRSRRIGLGIMGLADVFIMLKTRYGSKESVAIASKIMKTIAMGVYRGSVALAAERGEAPAVRRHRKDFANAYLPKKLFAENPKLAKDFHKFGIRNGVLLTIAPTGTTSKFASLFAPYAEGSDDISAGLEPNFSLRGGRNVMQKDGSKKLMSMLYAGWVDYCRSNNLDPITASIGNKDLPDYICTSSETHTLTVNEHVVVQAALQEWIDASISKTINCPKDIAFADFENIYMNAYNVGLKGCTTYRPSDVRGTVLLTEQEMKDKAAAEAKKTAPAKKARLPRRKSGTSCKDRWDPWETSIYTQIFHILDEEGKPQIHEIFFNTKNQRVSEFTTALGILLSFYARNATKEQFREAVVEMSQIVGVEGAFVPGDEGEKSVFFRSVVALMGSRILEEIDNLNGAPKSLLKAAVEKAAGAQYENVEAAAQIVNATNKGPLCPCGKTNNTRIENGCVMCNECDRSKCGD